MNIFRLLGVHEYLLFNFSLREYIFLYLAPTISFLIARPFIIMSMQKIFTWAVICVNGEHSFYINVNCAMRSRRLKRGWKIIFLLLASSINNNYRLQRDSLLVTFYLRT